MKKYENFNLIQKYDIQAFSGLDTEESTHFLNSIEKFYPISSTCYGITYPNPNYYIKRSPNTAFVLEYVISGKGYVIVNGKKNIVTAGDTYLLKPTEKCEYFSDKTTPYKKLWVNFKGPLAQEIISQYQLNDTVYKGIDLSENFEKLFKLEEISIDLDIVHFDLATIITEILIKIAKSNSVTQNVSQIASKVKYFLDTRLTQTFSLDLLSKNLFISKTEIIRYFKKAYGITPYQYFLNLKISNAKLMLESNSYSIIEISNFLAFSNPYHFSKIFKQKVGISPSEYKKKIKN